MKHFLIAPLLLFSAAPAFALTARWTDTSNNEQGFIVEQRPSGGMFTEAGRTGPNVTTVAVNPPFGQVTCYQVRAFNTIGVSAASNERCCSVPSQAGIALPLVVGTKVKKTIPNQPTNFIITP